MTEDRKEARQRWLQTPDNAEYRNDHLRKRRRADATRRRKKRIALDRELDRIDQENLEGNTRGPYQGIRLLKRGYQARTKLVKDAQGRIIVNEEEVINRWREFFETLLNRPNPEDPLDQWETQTAEELIPEPTIIEVQTPMKSLKNNKSPG